MLKFLPLFFFFAFPACIQPQGEWKVTEGSDFPDDKVETLKEGESTAGTVIQTLGVPYHRKNEDFIYAVRRTRPVVRSYLVYQSPFTQEVTHQTIIGFREGVVRDVESKSQERLLPRAE